MSSDARRTAERVARESYGRLLAFLAARTRDVAGAEDALAEAFASALATWPQQGVPDNPDGWLLTVARRRQADAWRRSATRQGGEAHLQLVREELDEIAMTSEAIPDRRLALMFACAHPDIDPDMRSALILQTILGLTAADIGAAFLVPSATMGQRLVRAKTRIAQRGIGFEIPDADALPERLDAVLEAIYAAYAKGWTDLDDEGQLAEEAIWLCRLVVSLLPQAAEAKGMLALMLYSHARRAARRAPDGSYMPLDQQDTDLWDIDAIRTAEALLKAASEMPGPSGRCQIEAAIQSAHIARRLTGANNWPAVLQLYDILLTMTRSPVVLLNRAAALAEVEGARKALESLTPLATDKRMQQYQPYWALQGHLLAETGDKAAAHEALTLAIGLSTEPVVRRWLDNRRKALQDG